MGGALSWVKNWIGEEKKVTEKGVIGNPDDKSRENLIEFFNAGVWGMDLKDGKGGGKYWKGETEIV